jgi:hypothetical protein
MQDPEYENPGRIPVIRILRILIFISVILRIGSAFYQGDKIRDLPGVADQISYHELSRRVLEGHGFSFGTGWWPATPAGRPTAHWSFLYVLYLSGVYSLFGVHPLAARLIQAILSGILHPLLAWKIGRRLFGIRVGLVSAALSSGYAYFVFYGGALMTEAFYIVAFLWALDLATEMSARSDSSVRSTRLASWIQLGTAFALAVRLRQVFLFLVPVILIWISLRLAWSTRRLSIRELAVRWAATLAILVICIAPWTLRNYRAFQTPVLLNTNSGFAFYWGNHPIHGTEFVPLLPAETYASLIPAELRNRNEAEMDMELLRRGFDFVRADPVRYLRLSISRFREYFRFWPSSGSGTASNYLRVLSSGLCIPLSFCGLLFVVSSHYLHGDNPTPRLINPGVSLLTLVAIIYTLLHVLTWTLIRYRLPLDAVAIPIAAVTVIVGYDRLKETVRSLMLDAHRPVS